MLTGLRLFLLGIWIGAMIGFAFIFAPIAFANVGPTPAFAHTIAQTLQSLTRSGTVIGALVVAITVFARRESARTAAAIVGLVAVMLVLGFVETTLIIPQMQATALQTPRYEGLHKESSTIYSIVLLCGLTSFALAARARASR